jgi:Raf kinase inhibitor-like YbhB/YbcL family protein
MGDGPVGLGELISAMTRENIGQRRKKCPLRQARTGNDNPEREERLSMALRLRSDAFGDGEPLPARYSRRGGNVAPPFDWDGVPSGAAELVLLAEDEDVLGSDGRPFLHWVLAGLPADYDGLGEGEEPEEARTGRNGFGELGYDGPEPPAGETHRYSFSLVAVSSPIEPSDLDVRQELDARTLDRASLSCRFGD